MTTVGNDDVKIARQSVSKVRGKSCSGPARIETKFRLYSVRCGGFP
jgi:hypothetical protein